MKEYAIPWIDFLLKTDVMRTAKGSLPLKQREEEMSDNHEGDG